MKRIHLSTILLIVIYGLLSLTTLFASDKSHQILLQSKLGNGFISDQALSGKVQGATANDIFSFVSQMESDEFVMQIPLSEADAVAFYSSGKETPPIIEGRYFTKEEQQSSNVYALVGQNRKDQVKNGQIMVGNINCKVVGIMGADIISPLDDLIFLNLSSQLSFIPDGFLLTLDGSETLYNIFQDYIKQQGAVFDSVTQDTVSVLDVAQGAINDEILYLMVMACFVLSCITFSYQWFLTRRKIMAVKSLLGINTFRIYMETIFLYITYLLLGCTIGAVAGIFLVTYINFKLFFVTLFVVILICIVLLILSLLRNRMISVAKAVK